MTDATEQPTATFREVRNVVRSRAEEAKAWAEFDRMLGEAGDLNRFIAQKQTDLDGLNRDHAAAQGRIAALNAEGEQIIAAARTEAQRLTDSATGLRSEAAKAKRETEALLAAAKVEAGKIIAAAHAEADRVAGVAADFATKIKPKTSERKAS